MPRGCYIEGALAAEAGPGPARSSEANLRMKALSDRAVAHSADMRVSTGQVPLAHEQALRV